ncbi:DUF2306 domain-containing protein [Pontixanthobacter aquaemixtae]|uniref:DUF2306 domain-containing protein n=1 Tax=Pontixanthobacter aquaemixtae TaxID=1958940 RepID=A0A844ZT74_9SPHN|nr:DUF2306 domain-containing protein [Pontixanthobacter aquaemixtae]MXO91113.1 DUF2306 domain-containing protein [Pontixanthobacter aquaemixtae]
MIASKTRLQENTVHAAITPGLSPKGGFDLGPLNRAIIGAASVAMSAICLFALTRGIMGAAPDHYGWRNWSVMIHVATVIPAVPLGGYLLLTRKGTKLHKMLGKVWLGLMVVTAIAIVFIRGGTDFSWIHIFVPMTLLGSYKAISTARARDIQAHKKHIVGMYMGALMIPGIFSFMPGRFMWALLFG